MSLSSKATLILACGVSCGVIFYVHYKQWLDKQKLHDGVLRDIERQQRRKIENLYALEQQRHLGKMLKNQERKEELALQLLEDDRSKNIQ